MTTLWRIEMLGWLRAVGQNRVVAHFPTRKTGALFAYLAFHAHRSHPREELIERFWPECELEAGRNHLRMALYRLRRQLEKPHLPNGAVILVDRQTVQLSPDAIVTDVAAFEATLQAAERAPNATERAQLLADAVEQYQGMLLPGYHDDWVLAPRQWLAERYCEALRQLMALREAAGDSRAALDCARRLVAADPLREEAHYELIRLLIAAGQPVAALRQYQELERLLQQELDAKPDAGTAALVREAERQIAARPAAVEVAPPVESLVVGEEALSSRNRERAKTRNAPEKDAGQTAGPEFDSEASLLPSLSRFRDFAISRQKEPEETTPATADQAALLEPVGGAVPLGSPFYLERPEDREFHAAIARRDSIVLVKGAREMGKTSLLARGLQQARRAGFRVVLTDFQMLNAGQLKAADTLLLTLAQGIADQLDLAVSPFDSWTSSRGPNPNFRRYMEREVLGNVAAPLVWALDQVDRLFTCDFGPDLFGLFRAWHNERALDPDGPWSRLTLAIAYATEAHLFIQDQDQSPFNVGTRLSLEEFTREQVAELNRRYGEPLRDAEELRRFCDLVSGHPYLVRRGLHEMATHDTTIQTFEARAGSEDWIFGDHLRRLLALLTRDAESGEAMRSLLRGQPCASTNVCYRLRSAGVVVGETRETMRPRCQLYASFLGQHLTSGEPPLRLQPGSAANQGGLQHRPATIRGGAAARRFRGFTRRRTPPE
jgi:DNA-binding SARP family transcriptional activator